MSCQRKAHTLFWITNHIDIAKNVKLLCHRSLPNPTGLGIVLYILWLVNYETILSKTNYERFEDKAERIYINHPT